MKYGDHKWWKLTEPDFARKIRISGFWAKRSQNGPKINVFGFFSKSAPRIFLILWTWLEGIIALILPKTAYSAKIRFRSYGPKRPKNRVFSKAHISWTEIAMENLIRFSESSVLSPQKMSLSDFPYLDPFTLKIESEHRNRKKSQFWFFDFLKFGLSDFGPATMYVVRSYRITPVVGWLVG